MKQFLVSAGPASFPKGTVLGLTAKQAGARVTQLDADGPGRFKARQTVHFKAGESIRIEGDPPKALRALLVEQKGPELRTAPAGRRVA